MSGTKASHSGHRARPSGKPAAGESSAKREALAASLPDAGHSGGSASTSDHICDVPTRLCNPAWPDGRVHSAPPRRLRHHRAVGYVTAPA